MQSQNHSCMFIFQGHKFNNSPVQSFPILAKLTCISLLRLLWPQLLLQSFALL